MFLHHVYESQRRVPRIDVWIVGYCKRYRPKLHAACARFGVRERGTLSKEGPVVRRVIDYRRIRRGGGAPRDPRESLTCTCSSLSPLFTQRCACRFLRATE